MKNVMVVDTENMMINIDMIKDIDINQVVLFINKANCKKLDTELISYMSENKIKLKIIDIVEKIKTSNNMDFHIIAYISRHRIKGKYYIVSNDTGYVNVCEFLNTQYGVDIEFLNESNRDTKNSHREHIINRLKTLGIDITIEEIDSIYEESDSLNIFHNRFKKRMSNWISIDEISRLYGLYKSSKGIH